jgi:hypothetical protein
MPARIPYRSAAVLALILAAATSRAESLDGTYYARQYAFRIPFQTDTNDRRVREVQLYVAEDPARTWQQVAKAQPGEKYFSFQAKRDGWYWFTVRTIDTEDHAYPASMDGVAPRLKVCVDTQAPIVTLRAAQVAGGTAGVEWDVRDDNLDVESLKLEYRLTNSSEWVAVPITKAGTGSKGWNPATNAPIEVKLSVRDLAGNPAEQVANVTPAAWAKGNNPATADPVNPNVRMVNSKRISINYELKEVGKSGIALIELWFTRDGRSWQKYDEQANPQPPYKVEVSDEGLYGFTLVARNKAGFGEAPPRVGDQPQIWVEVDLTRPVVRLQSVDVGRGAETGNLTITYNVTDKNLGRQPITISYAEKPDGHWTPVARNEENTGRYVWRMPEDLPYQFYVRVEATDRAGNVGSAETARAVVVDLSQPKVNVIGVDPGK